MRYAIEVREEGRKGWRQLRPPLGRRPYLYDDAETAWIVARTIYPYKVASGDCRVVEFED